MRIKITESQFNRMLISEDNDSKTTKKNKKKKTDYTISEFLELERQKLRKWNSEAHDDDKLDWSDWKSEINKSEAKEYGIYFNTLMKDRNGDRGVFEYLPTNSNYEEDEDI